MFGVPPLLWGGQCTLSMGAQSHVVLLFLHLVKANDLAGSGVQVEYMG